MPGVEICQVSESLSESVASSDRGCVSPSSSNVMVSVSPWVITGASLATSTGSAYTVADEGGVSVSVQIIPALTYKSFSVIVKVYVLFVAPARVFQGPEDVEAVCH